MQSIFIQRPLPSAQFLLVFLTSTLLFSSNVKAQFQFEPNDSFNEAYTIDFNSIYEAAIYLNGDVDFFKLDVPTGAVIEFNGLQFPSNLEMRVSIYDCPNELCELTTINLVNNVVRYYKVCSAGTYYFKIFDSDNNEGNLLSYFFGITIDSTDHCEKNGCNDIISNACQIEINQPIQAAINSVGDADYYKFEVPVESVLNINVLNIDNDINMTTALYNAPDELNGKIMEWTSNFSGTDVNRFWKICTPGTYYLKLFDAGNNDRSSQLYDLIVRIDSTDKCEFNGCNDVITNACLIETNQPIQAAINSFEDADYYKFEVPVASIININVQNIQDDISMTTVLYDAPNESNSLVTWTSINSGNNVNRFWKICTPGTYYLKLFDAGNNDRSSQLYDLVVGIDSSDAYECNDTELTAYDIKLCSDTLLAAINLAGDQDYFSFNAPANINISIEVTNVPGNIDMEVELALPNSNSVIASGNNGSSVSLHHLTLQEGEYILHLFDDGNNDFNPSLYQVVIKLVPEFNLPTDLQNLCINDAPVMLSGGSPIGGYYSGIGVDSISGIFNPSEAGVGSHLVTFTFIDTTISCMSSVDELITVHDLPTGSLILPTDTVFFTEGPLVLQGGMPGGGMYSGIGVDSIAGTFNPSVGIGTYTIAYEVTDFWGCSNTFFDAITVVQMSNLNPAILGASLVVSPNPFSEHFNIKMGQLYKTVQNISMLNMDGETIFFSDRISSEDFRVDVNHLPAGIYMIRLMIGDMLYSTKIIKQ